jgi:hypothetical protein
MAVKNDGLCVVEASHALDIWRCKGLRDYLVAEVLGNDDDARKLAALFVAAPDLLAALKLAIKPGPDGARGPRRVAIEVAIAKAEGTTHGR